MKNMPSSPRYKSPTSFVSILKILAIYTALCSLFFSGEIPQSVRHELLDKSSIFEENSSSSSFSTIVIADEEASSAVTASAPAVVAAAAAKAKPPRYAIMNATAPGFAVPAKKKKKPPRYAIAMYVDADDHIYGLYSILKQAIRTGMVDDGVEIVVGVSAWMMAEEERHDRTVEMTAPGWIDSQFEKLEELRVKIEQNEADREELLQGIKRGSLSLLLAEKDWALLAEKHALLAARKEVAKGIRKFSKMKKFPESRMAARMLNRWHKDGLIHKIYPFKQNHIQDIVRDSGLWEGVFNKLFLFNLTEYDKVIRLDCDVLIRQNLMHWFDYGTPCAIQAHDELEWNSGVMVISPNRTVFDDMVAKLPDVERVEYEGKTKDEGGYLFDPLGSDEWNSGIGEQGFLSSYFTTNPDPSLRMKTMPTEDAICISSLQRKQMQYFWFRRNHIFSTVHMTTLKPWYQDSAPGNRVGCDVMREWVRSVDDLKERYNLTVPNLPLRNCENDDTIIADETTGFAIPQ